LTFDAAQESHEARSFSFLSFADKDVFGVEVGEDMIDVDIGLSLVMDECQLNRCEMEDIIVVDIEGTLKSRCRVEGKLSVVLPRCHES
jgi:hypothetical protein